MSIKIDVIYQDGEAVAFRNAHNQGGKKLLEFFRALEFDLVLRFCNADGEPAEITPAATSGKVQLLLSRGDRLLASVDEGAVWSKDERNFTLLSFNRIAFDTGDVRNVLADSYLELEPNYRGRAECELSVAVYSNDALRETMQMFITMDALLKDTPARQ